MRRFILARSAASDVRQIYEYVFEQSPSAAKRLLRKLRGSFAELGRMPGMGHVREDLTEEDLRFWSVGAYLVIYQPHSTPIEIIHVVHSARDVRALLEDE